MWAWHVQLRLGFSGLNIQGMNCPACGSQTAPGMRFCGMCGSPLAAPAQRERRVVSVVFIDLAGFTTLTHGLDPEALRDLADEVLTAVAGIVEEFSGHVDAFRGDGLIAVFGAPRSHADDAERAVNAAAAGLRAIERIGAAKGTGLKGRAGVSTGVVIAGELGSGRVREYTVMGSTVNLAARVEAAATPGEVWVSPATFEATRYRMNFEPTGPVRLAGFPDISQLYVLRSNPEPVTADPNAHLKFVGRKDALAMLGAALAEVRTTRAVRELWVSGDTGIGKSRLLREFTGPQLPEPALVLWPAERSGASLSWFALARAMFRVPGSAETMPQQSEVEAVLLELLPDEPRWRRQILASLGFVELQPYTRLERRRVNRTSLSWRDLLVALARSADRPLVLVIESHVEDPELVEFLQLLREAEAPVLILRTTRSPERPETGEWLRLPPLSMAESLELLNQVAHPVMRPATEALVYQVAGVPAYILELGRALSVTEDVSFTGSLEAVLQARLDRLSQDERQLLALAALTGERTWTSLLLELGGPGAARALEQLLSEHILREQTQSRIPGEAQLRFQSELLRHAVLQMVPFSDRPLRHLRIATWLETRAPFELSELIAKHFRSGASHDAALPHYLAALDLAVRDAPESVPALISDVQELRLQETQRLVATLAAADAARAAKLPELARELLQAAEALPIQSPQEREAAAVRLQQLRELLEPDAAEAPEPDAADAD